MINLTEEQMNVPLEGNIVLNDIPFLNKLTFTPSIIEWNGVVDNPLYTGSSKTVEHYLSKYNPNRASKDPISLNLNSIFENNPELKTEENLNLPLGIFIKKLKDSNNPEYKSLVNPSGDEEDYVKFKSKSLTKELGLYIWVIDNKPVYVGIAGAKGKGLANRINQEYGNITPYKCTIDGHSQTCKSNSKLRDLFKAKKNISLYVSPIDTDSLLQNKEFIDYMSKNFNFKGTRQDKNVLEVFEKYLINKYNFKSDISWNARLEEITLYNRMKKLAGIK